MRTYGSIGNVSFKLEGFCIYNLSYEYTLIDNSDSKTVYANSMVELREEISKFSGKPCEKEELPMPDTVEQGITYGTH